MTSHYRLLNPLYQLMISQQINSFFVSSIQTSEYMLQESLTLADIHDREVLVLRLTRKWFGLNPGNQALNLT